MNRDQIKLAGLLMTLVGSMAINLFWGGVMTCVTGIIVILVND